MSEAQQKRVNIIITDHVIRYMYIKKPSVDGVKDYGEKPLLAGIVEDGKIKDQAAFEKVLKSLVKEKKWNRQPLYFCVPETAVSIREHVVPKGLTKQEIKSYVYMELEENLSFPFKDPIFDFEVIGEAEDKTKILLFAYPRERVNQFVQTFQNAGLKPVVADLSSLSLYRLYYSLNKASQDENLLAVQWGKDAIVLTAFKQLKPVFTRYIKTSSDPLRYDILTKEYVLTENDALVEQYIESQLVTIQRFMDFFQFSVSDSSEPITKLLLAGDFPDMEKIEMFVKERFSISVESMHNNYEALQIPAKFSDVLGLALKDNKE
ncbi:type IV pilus biogenesis protein PilM [Radiobacillus sp. PE A8.2]|uniref:type IV pilus biogenesis protein PilM n=1 Tax=Radiobacillus sp. PE A8.2 TaxID=3380349 RepID=UPI00388E5880